jgi:hypothetical protein
MSMCSVHEGVVMYAKLRVVSALEVLKELRYIFVFIARACTKRCPVQYGLYFKRN